MWREADPSLTFFLFFWRGHASKIHRHAHKTCCHFIRCLCHWSGIMMLCCVTILPYASPVILDIPEQKANHLAAESGPVSCPLTVTAKSTEIKTFLRTLSFLFRSVLEDNKMFAQFCFGFFPRMATVHEFNRRSFLQIVLELIDDYVCNLKWFDTIKVFKLVIGFVSSVSLVPVFWAVSVGHIDSNSQLYLETADVRAMCSVTRTH